MRFRMSAAELERTAEEELENRIRAANTRGGMPVMSRDFWNDLRVRTNERIDRAGSGRAITLSWAARVAIPGVVALVSFLVGLHYYAPFPGPAGTPLASVLAELPDGSVDSLVVSAAAAVDSADADLVNDTMFDAGADEIAAYLVEAGAATEVGEFLADGDVDRILQAMTKPSTQVDS